ncbi:MAG: hypothetical protein AAF941_04020 [Pseudomonadota bacterium]
MKLIIHPGLHKTGSTYLQHVLNSNHAQLAARGVWYQPQKGYPAHHFAAWRILLGDPQPLEAMVNEARDAKCDTVILSSEDLEGALYDERPLRAIDAAATSARINEIEWHIVLRDPGAAFASLFAQLQHHVYADAFQLFYDVMRRGFAYIATPMPGSGTPYWYYCFDYLRDLTHLHDWACAPVIAHDFAAKAAFPGAGILERAGVLDAIETLPGPEARNARPTRDDIIRGFVARVTDVVPEDADQRRIVEGFLGCLENGLDNIETYAELVSASYSDKARAALAKFGALETVR